MPIIACSVDGCEKKVMGRGLCHTHYRPRNPKPCVICGAELIVPYGKGMCTKHFKRWKKHGDPHYERPLIVGVAECTIDGCSGIIQARGWCSMHWSRWDRYGDPLHRYGYEIHDGKRVCARCKVDKPVEDFGLRLNSYCMRCTADQAIERRKLGLTDQEKAWAYSAARRAQKLSTTVEKFTRLEIFERDNWTCQLCNKAIDPTLRHPDPWHGNVDHVIPLARGGTHTRENAQASHFRCNLQKGVRIPA